MKVTKTIREYIEKQVYDKAYNSKNIINLKKEMGKAKHDFNEDKERCREVCMNYVNDLSKKYMLNPERIHYNVHFAGLYDFELPEVIAYNNAEKELRQKAEQAILDIIVEMEMGGTKAELMEKLNDIEF